MSVRPELEAAVEAILFVTAEPVSEERLLATFDESEREDARAALAAVSARYAAAEGRGVLLEEVAGGLRIVTAPECHPYLRRFFDVSGANRLSMAALETLAIVAYRQPVTGPEIHELRGKNSSTALRTLLDRRMIRIAGRKEVVGRPFVYTTTRDFLMHFGLATLADLPPLEEFEEAFGGEAGERAEPAFEHDHEVLGLLSTEEAEATLGSARFDVHEHREHEDDAAAAASGGADDGTESGAGELGGAGAEAGSPTEEGDGVTASVSDRERGAGGGES